MDAPELSPKLLDAGADYLSSLDRLGLKVDGLWWVYDFNEKAFLLWLVWAGVERYGPLEIQQRLFAAYNASALPKAVDPFIVHVMDPRSSLVKSARAAYNDPSLQSLQFGMRAHEGSEISPTFELQKKWVYRFNKKRQTSLEQSKNWNRFDQKIMQLAS